MLAPTITLPRAGPLVDEPVAFTVAGCQPGERVTIGVTVEIDGAVFRSAGEYEADAGGAVDPAHQPSCGGTYTGVDPYGLWWSGEPQGPAQPPVGRAPTELTVAASGGRAACSLDRRWFPDGVTTATVTDQRFAGTLFRPAGPGPFPAVVAVGGSGGGFGPAAAWAPVLAARGFAALALGFFAMPGLPAEMVEVPVEIVDRAIAWLRQQPGVADGPVGMMGQSRGSELSLLAAATTSEIGAVVVIAPSGVSWGGFGPQGPIEAAAWSVGGEPFPYAGRVSDFPGPGERPPALAPFFLAAMEDQAALRAAELPVERISGPVLAISGVDDAMWPATPLTEIAERRAAAQGFPHDFVHLRYDDAGHLAGGVPGTPIRIEVVHGLEGSRVSFGGSAPGTAAARADSWPRILQFLRQSLAAPPT